MSLKIIGISGKAETGKDHIAKTYLRPLGFNVASLADHFKLTIVGRGLATFEEVFYTKPPHVRKLLQEEGTERGRNVYGEDVWCRTLVARLQLEAERNGLTKWVIPDIRFPNEVQYVQRNGGEVFRIFAPDRAAASKLSEEARQHPSETALDQYDPEMYYGDVWMPKVQFFDALVDNRLTKSTEQLDAQVWNALRIWGVISPKAVLHRVDGEVRYDEYAMVHPGSEDCPSC